VHERQAGGRRGGGHRLSIQAVFEDRIDRSIRARAGEQGPGTRRVQALRAIALGEPPKAQAGAVPLLGMRATLEDALDESLRVRSSTCTLTTSIRQWRDKL